MPAYAAVCGHVIFSREASECHARDYICGPKREALYESNG